MDPLVLGYTQRHLPATPEDGYNPLMTRLIIWIIVGLLALSFFGISLRGLVDSPTNQDNVSFLTQMLNAGWDMISTWVEDLWDSIRNLW